MKFFGLNITRAIIKPASTQTTTELFSRPSNSGVLVTPQNAMEITTVFACIKVLAEGVATLPISLYKEDNKSKVKAKEHSLYNILHIQPNNESIAFNFYECMVAHLCLRGVFYAQIIRSNIGKILELIPLKPSSMQKVRLSNGDIRYIYIDDNSKLHYFTKEDIFEVLGMSLDGFTPVSTITYQREALGLSKATETYGSTFFKNSANPSGILEIPTELSDEAYKRLVDSWNAKHNGNQNANKVALLEGGTQWKQIGLSNEDSQFLETRKFQKAEICGLFKVPPHMIGDLEKATFSNIEQQSIDFAVHTLSPYLVRIEQNINTQLLTKAEQLNYFSKFSIDGLLRGDISSRYTAYNMGRNMGVLSANDIRAKEDLNPIENGDIYLQPLNMGEAGVLPTEVKK